MGEITRLEMECGGHNRMQCWGGFEGVGFGDF